jgi:hypothetical protein
VFLESLVPTLLIHYLRPPFDLFARSTQSGIKPELKGR